MSLNMDWMYKRPGIDTEAYLLGKPIDKSLEALRNPDGCPTSNEDIGEKPGALFLEAAASAALEAEAKVREDPLYTIKKREEEQRRQLLNNPVRLKKLQDEMKQQRREAEKKSGTVSEKTLLSKMMKLKSKYGADLKEILSSALDSDSDNDEKHHHRKSAKRMHEKSRSREREQRRMRSADRRSSRERRHSGHSKSDRGDNYTPRRTHRSRTRSRSPERRQRSPLHRPERSRNLEKPKVERSTDKHRATIKPVPPKSTATSSKLMNPAELEQKRLDMMSAAKQRDEDRAQNVKDYKKKDTEEETKNAVVATGKAGGFIMPLMRSAVDNDTLESRIKSSRQNIQRTRAALEKNFTDR